MVEALATKSNTWGLLSWVSRVTLEGVKLKKGFCSINVTGGGGPTPNVANEKLKLASPDELVCTKGNCDTTSPNLSKTDTPPTPFPLSSLTCITTEIAVLGRSVRLTT